MVGVLGTQRVISFLRQMVEHGGFYRTSDQAWVKFERIQFVGACNPPTDPGRKPLSHRSAAAVHCSVVIVPTKFSDFCVIAYDRNFSTAVYKQLSNHFVSINVCWLCNTHTHTHPFNCPFSGTTQVSRYQKGKNQSGFY